MFCSHEVMTSTAFTQVFCHLQFIFSCVTTLHLQSTDISFAFSDRCTTQQCDTNFEYKLCVHLNITDDKAYLLKSHLY